MVTKKRSGEREREGGGRERGGGGWLGGPGRSVNMNVSLEALVVTVRPEYTSYISFSISSVRIDQKGKRSRGGARHAHETLTRVSGTALTRSRVVR